MNDLVFKYNHYSYTTPNAISSTVTSHKTRSDHPYDGGIPYAVYTSPLLCHSQWLTQLAIFSTYFLDCRKGRDGGKEDEWLLIVNKYTRSLNCVPGPILTCTRNGSPLSRLAGGRVGATWTVASAKGVMGG